MGQTDIYKLGYFQPFQNIGDDLQMDQRRFQAIENQLKHLFAIWGNGVLEDDPLNPSWRIQNKPGATTVVVQITSGSGHVDYKFGETTIARDVALALPSGGAYPLWYWLYAQAITTTPSTKNVLFFVSTVQLSDPTLVGLGAVYAESDGSNITLTPYNDSDHGRVVISLFASLASIVNKHKHVGGANNPSPIDLARHVRDKLSGDFIENLDASTVTRGFFAPERIPQIDHNSLLHRGTLTHDQIDSLLAGLLGQSGSFLSDLFTANMLQLALALKKQTGLSGIDTNLINAILYIPGITPRSYEAYYSTGDTGCSTPYVPGTVPLAAIDHTAHQIVGSMASPISSDQIEWTTDTDFAGAYADALARVISPDPPSQDIEVTGTGTGGSITDDRPISYLGINTVDMADWDYGYRFTDGSSLTRYPASPPPPPSNDFHDTFTVRRFLYHEFTSPQDWTGRQKLGIGWGLTTPSDPGDIYIFLVVSSGGSAQTFVQSPGGTAKTLSIGSAAKIGDPASVSGGRAYSIKNLSEVATTTQLGSVVGIGFYWDSSSATPWDKNDLDYYLLVPSPTEIDDDRVNSARTDLPDTTSAIFIWNETLYAALARLVFRFDSNFDTTLFDNIAYDATVPGGTTLRIKTRAAVDESDLETTQAYAIQITGDIDSNSHVGRFLDIIVELLPNSARSTAPILDDLILNFRGPGAPANKVWDTQAEWLTGRTFINITAGGDNKLRLTDATKVGQFKYIRGNNLYEAYGVAVSGSPLINGTDETTLQDGGLLYATPWQTWYGGAHLGFESPHDFIVLPDGHFVIADRLNDRVTELDADGNLVKALQGNLRMPLLTRDFVALTAVYNPRLGKLWIAFSQNVTVSDRTKMALISGTDAILLSDAKVNVVPFQPINGKAATLEVTFTSDLVTRINGWTDIIKVSLGAGSVTSGGAGGTGGSGGFTPSGGGTTGINSGSDGGGPSILSGGGVVQIFSSGCDGTGLPDFIKGPTPLPPLFTLSGSGSQAGTLVCEGGLDDGTTEDSGGGGGGGTPTCNHDTDFNCDGSVDTTLQGPGGQVNTVVLTVYKGEVVWDNLFSPVSIQVTDLNEWVVAMGGTDSIVKYDSLLVRMWQVPTSVLVYRDGFGGSAREMNNNILLTATPAGTATGSTGQVLLINRIAGNVAVATLGMVGDAVYALEDPDDLHFWVAVDDRAGNGNQSRVVHIDSGGGVIWTWGTGVLVHPTGLHLLPNSQILVSE